MADLQTADGSVVPGDGRGRAVRAAIWLPGLAVALGAAVATAHGLFEVAVAARVPHVIAWLYPLITDGLALVAYAATAKLTGPAARYAWTVVVVAAGLSGLAQAAFLAGDNPTGVVATPAALRFGVGAWPAVAAAVVAHLLYLLATEHHTEPGVARPSERADMTTTDHPAAGSVQSDVVQPEHVQPALNNASAVQDELPGPPVQEPSTQQRLAQPDGPSGSARSAPPAASPMRDRAEAAAVRHARRQGAWPSVSELEMAAQVSRGTAAAALKALRGTSVPPPHLITRPPTAPDTDAPADEMPDTAQNPAPRDRDDHTRTQP